MNPIAFLVVGQDKVKLLPVNFNTTVDRVVELVPQVVEQIQDLFDNNKVKNRGLPLPKSLHNRAAKAALLF